MFYHVILEKPWNSSPSELELRFFQNLEDDKNNGITNEFENLDNDLKEVQKQRDESRRPLQEIQPQPFGPDIASELFKQNLC
ncbi:hypothetical protein GLOIN_2v1761399 [Rhizophagus clarus]|uniref:Uncharacterized protein n=1 Tax=Rhizophagus clarus TaxID=94130 RepID=A0A8H3L878_9GLOM|nr:hypothetical protein GLOIN_2v1761399 [Rhizophagus clarus]